MRKVIKNGTIVSDGVSFIGTLLVNGEIIEKIINHNVISSVNETNSIIKYFHPDKIIDVNGMYVIPGAIDDQVHFREPGNTAKATIESESIAAVLGGVTSFMDMPNNYPAATTKESLDNKFNIAEKSSYANYSFYIGATNDNLDEIKSVDSNKVCGVKVFMGSSTGNMLVNSNDALDSIFRESPLLIATHCEDEDIIQNNLVTFKERFGDKIPFESHPDIRSREACIECSKRAIQYAIKNNSRLHLLHISTADEIDMVKEAQKINPNITGEVCVHYMWFCRDDFKKYGSKIKCNPALKDKSDMLAIRKAVKDGTIKVVATDHAPHLASEKSTPYLTAPSGLPLVQHSLLLMLEMVNSGIFTIEEVVDRMAHSPANCFKIENRGYIKEGFYADLAIISSNQFKVNQNNIAYKCNWSPFEDYTFKNSIVHTFVNGAQVVENGIFTGEMNSKPLSFKNFM